MKKKNADAAFFGENRGLALRGDNYLCRQGGEGRERVNTGGGWKKEGCEASGRRRGLPSLRR